MERFSQERASRAGGGSGCAAPLPAPGPHAGPDPDPGPGPGPSKLPDVTPWFWLAQILTAGLGGTTADFLVRIAGPVPAVALALGAAAATLVVQFRADRYAAWVYWPAVVAVSVAGAVAADTLHMPGGVSRPVAAGVFALAVAAVLAGWQAGEGTLTVRGMRRPRREAFYWAAVLAVCGLGTALGDAAVSGLDLDYVTACGVFALLVAVPAIGAVRFRLHASAAFWSAYLLIRPLGACCADGLEAPLARGGLGWGAGPVSTLLAVVLAGLVGRLADEQRTAGLPPGPPR
jgi:uncharacterized membrane-anchored protein